MLPPWPPRPAILARPSAGPAAPPPATRAHSHTPIPPHSDTPPRARLGTDWCRFGTGWVGSVPIGTGWDGVWYRLGRGFPQPSRPRNHRTASTGGPYAPNGRRRWLPLFFSAPPVQLADPLPPLCPTMHRGPRATCPTGRARIEDLLAGSHRPKYMITYGRLAMRRPLRMAAAHARDRSRHVTLSSESSRLRETHRHGRRRAILARSSIAVGAMRLRQIWFSATGPSSRSMRNCRLPRHWPSAATRSWPSAGQRGLAAHRPRRAWWTSRAVGLAGADRCAQPPIPFGHMESRFVILRPPKINSFDTLGENWPGRPPRFPRASGSSDAASTSSRKAVPRRTEWTSTCRPPVLIIHWGGQFGVANTMAMQSANLLAKDTPDPYGGKYLRSRRDGLPDGVLIHYPHLQRSRRRLTDEEYVKCATFAFERFAQVGVTCIHDNFCMPGWGASMCRWRGAAICRYACGCTRMLPT